MTTLFIYKVPLPVLGDMANSFNLAKQQFKRYLISIAPSGKSLEGNGIHKMQDNTKALFPCSELFAFAGILSPSTLRKTVRLLNNNF